jgi:hypothetical protein
VLPKAMVVGASGLLRVGRSGRLTITVRDRNRHAVKGAKVTVTGAGLATRRAKTNRKGSVTITVRPRKRGKVTVVGRHSGFADGNTTVKVR